MAAVIGFFASVLFSMIIDWETVGGVAIVSTPLFVVSVVLVCALETVSANSIAKLTAFISPLFLAVGAAAYAMWVDAQAIKSTGVSDGSGDVVWFLLKAYLAGLAVASVCLVALVRRGSPPAGMGAEQSLSNGKNLPE